MADINNPFHLHEGTFSQQVKKYERQADLISLMDLIAEQNKAARDLILEIKEVLWFMRPQQKWWNETLDPVREVHVRYEGRQHCYMNVPASGIQIVVRAWGITNSFTANQGWNNLTYPENSTITTSTGNQPVLMLVSNEPIVGGIL